MIKRQNIPSGAKWEDIIGYSRAVRMGNTLEVSGTVAVNDDGIVGKGDFYEQTRFIIEKIEGVLHRAGFVLEDVVRTRIYVTDIRHWNEVGKAHGERFGAIKPATSMIQVSGFIEPDYLVEMEVTAIRPT